METKKCGAVTIAYAMPRLDVQTSPEFGTELQAIIAAGAKTLVCNLAKTEYVSSAGLRTILAAAKTLKRSGGELCLCSVSPLVYKVIEAAALTDILRVFQSEEEALETLATP